ncbi:hypothetical protein PoB_001750300 [Plakobranchus ocellatus]|uniref:Uncharacterized protein n=1 Tax=Plakobranchus ocellatus TaxID=259542 RepID=A0AAV3Z979_9GAST|nr:hypothetical protein PoB_001750300 [Plakobranchus ocellatus]
MNCCPRSDWISFGKPSLVKMEKRAPATSFAVILRSGTASAQRVDTSTSVSRYSYLSHETGSGPTRSITTLSKGSPKLGPVGTAQADLYQCEA